MSLQEAINDHWRKKLFKLCLIFAIVGLCAEVIIYCVDTNTKVLFLPNNIYRIRFIYIPTVLDAIFFIITYVFVFRSNLNVKYKNTLSCILIYLISANMQIVHYVYAPVLVLPIIAIFISVIFVDRKLTHSLAIASLFSLLISTILSAHELRKGDLQLITDSGLAATIILISLIASDKMIDYVKEQLAHILESKKRESILIQELHIDPLMGIYNRMALDEQMNECVNLDYTNNNCHMLLLDIDDFKLINDTYGHLNGDEVLVELSETIKHYTGTNITAFRFGGEEIILIIRNYSAEYAYQIAENLRTEFSELSFDFAPELSITFSSGLATLHIKQTAEDWMQHADSALYQAKHLGKNRTIKYTE